VRQLTRLVAVAAAAALALSGCGGGDDDEPGTEASASTEALRVGMAFDTGGRGDGTFNDLAAAGLDQAKTELGAEIQELSPKEDGSDRADLLRQLADDGYNPIVGVGFAYGEAIDTVAKEYPDVQFVRIDGGPSAEANVAVKTFREEQGSFLVGVAAALKTKTNHVGFIGGNESQLITKFYAGFVQGAKSVKPDITIDEKRLAAGEDTKGFGDTTGARVAAESMYQAGADIIYTAAGGSWGGSFPAAASAGKLAIGVDSDQYNTVGDPALQKVILTSMLKRVDTAVFEAAKEFQTGKKVTNGSYGLDKDGVGYSTSGGFVDDINAQLEEQKAKIISGEVKVSETA
jgi:basic membrane protein A and related proteins